MRAARRRMRRWTGTASGRQPGQWRRTAADVGVKDCAYGFSLRDTGIGTDGVPMAGEGRQTLVAPQNLACCLANDLHVKKCLYPHGSVVNPRGTTRYRCSLRLALRAHASITFHATLYETALNTNDNRSQSMWIITRQVSVHGSRENRCRRWRREIRLRA